MSDSSPNKADPKAEEPESELVKEEELSVTDGGAAKLKPVEISSGEEDEDVIFRKRAKIYRFDDGENCWKERGQGEARILRHKVETNKCRFLLRREGTMKLGANHYILKGMSLKKNAGDDRSWVWKTPADSSDEEVQPELFAIKFANKELAVEFQTVFLDCVAKAPG